jgi:phenylalanyl-tRNA synthetase beta chain
MKVPVSWLRDFVAIPESATGRDVAAMLLGVGFEVESVETVGDVRGQLVVGRVSSIEELTEFKKPIRWCQVEVGAANGAEETPGVRGIVCGARNFEEGDLVIVALSGTTLPGDFTIATRETYGHISDGMMCSPRELGLSDDHGGLIVLPAGSAQPGDDAFPILGLGDEVLDIAITPDRGYALSVRGLAREVAIAQGVDFVDPGVEVPALPEPSGDAISAASEDSQACDLLVLHTVEGFDPAAPTPDFIKNRLAAVGVRSISLAVDVTNYVMFELGQPLHAFDADKVKGTIRARRAVVGEKLETLDHVVRELDADDLVIADDSGALSLAGTMGGFATEISDSTTRIVIEAAHFDSVVVARMSRRHKLSSESSRRFERGVDRMLAPVAAARALELLLAHGGATYAGTSGVESAPDRTVIAFDPQLPSRIAGHDYATSVVESTLTAVGCLVDTSGETWTVRPPSWRPDLDAPIDLVEEVVRIDGFDKVPSRLPTAPKGRGLTAQQRLRRHVGVYLASRGLVEVRNYPFIGVTELDAMGLEAGDPRRNTLQLANPLSDEAPLMRTSLLPGIASALGRNVSRGFNDVALFEMASVCWLWDAPDADAVAPRVSVAGRPSDTELASLNALLPEQPLHAGAILTGSLASSGWWGTAAPATWRDAIELVVALGRELGVEVTVANGQVAPWHPGRCADLSINGQTFGHAGELAPRAAAAMGVPARSVAFEFNVDLLIEAAQSTPRAPRVWTYPVAKEDLALVVDKATPAAGVMAVIEQAAGELLEEVRLFDVYDGAQVPEGKKSLAFALRFRASDRTLEAAEVATARQAVISAAEAAFGATLR